MFDWVQPLLDGINVIVEFLSQFVESIITVVGYIGEAVVLIGTIGPLLPAPVTTLLVGWSAIMILYSVKGS